MKSAALQTPGQSGQSSTVTAEGVLPHREIPPQQEMLTLDDVRAYRHPGLVARIMSEQGIGEEEATKQFDDLMIFLYVCGAHRDARPFFPPPLIDEAWHTFLLFTKDYAEFCKKHFGFFIHHSPITPELKEKHQLAKVDKRKAIGIAESLLGTLSPNWILPKGETADCPQSCCPSYDGD
jgi:hypothetical protein